MMKRATIRYIITSYLSFLILIYLGGVGYAMPHCQQNNTDSVYCDESWRGLNSWHHILQSYGYSVTWSESFQADDADIHAVHVWLSSPDISPDYFEYILLRGVKLLIFDESAHSLNWFRSKYQADAISMDSPYDAEASHINGNPDLPVIEINRHEQETLGMRLDNEDVWMMALNHPTPIVINHDQSHDIIYYFNLTASEGTGRAYIFRDESLPTRLMINTLQNAKVIQSVIQSLCDDIKPCSVILYEPSFHYIPSENISNNELEQWLSDAGDFIQYQKQSVSDFWDHHADVIERIPWTFLLTAISAAWCIIALLVSVPFGRGKP